MKKTEKYTKGEFGTIYTQFQNKPKEAIKWLKKMKEGECIKALYNNTIGYIDLVWGENNENNKGFGLKHIIEKHGADIKALGFEIEDFIPIIITTAGKELIEETETKFVVSSSTFRFVVKKSWENKSKRFLLSAFDIKKKPTKR